MAPVMHMMFYSNELARKDVVPNSISRFTKVKGETDLHILIHTHLPSHAFS